MTIIQASVGKSRGRPRSAKRELIVSQAQSHFAVERPMTLRHLWYLLLSDGTIKLSTKKTAKARAKEDHDNYTNLSSWIVAARMESVVSFSAIVDGLRDAIKPSSWSGLEDFGEACRTQYRKNLWARQKDYIEFWFEKDAIIGVVEDIASKYDVKMRPLRGQSSLTFLHQAALEINAIQKPVFIYYFGDHDPSGYSIEDSARSRLQDLLWKLSPEIKDAKIILTNDDMDDDPPHTVGTVNWKRLGFKYRDLARTDIMPLEAKRSDTNYKKFLARFLSDSRAAELDALPTAEIRRRLRRAIGDHVDAGEWLRLRKIERMEKKSVDAVFAQLGKPPR